MLNRRGTTRRADLWAAPALRIGNAKRRYTMGLRVITGVMNVKGYPQPGSIEITYNPLTIVATNQADVIDLQVFGDGGYFANKPFVLLSVNNLTIEDLINPSGSIHNRIYRLETGYTTDPENIFQRVVYHRAIMRWDYGPTGDEWSQGRVDRISFMITGDAVPLDEAPLQPLPLGPFGFAQVEGGIYLTVEKHQVLRGKLAITHCLKTRKDVARSLEHLMHSLEECGKKAAGELHRHNVGDQSDNEGH
jgi:hypothetical protein